MDEVYMQYVEYVRSVYHSGNCERKAPNGKVIIWGPEVDGQATRI